MVTTRTHLNKVKGYVDTGIKEGARLLSTVAISSSRAMRRAILWVAACLTTLRRRCASTSEEIFGPVLSVVRAKDL